MIVEEETEGIVCIRETYFVRRMENLSSIMTHSVYSTMVYSAWDKIANEVSTAVCSVSVERTLDCKTRRSYDDL